jgi:hypothetical protein
VLLQRCAVTQRLHDGHRELWGSERRERGTVVR